jgi:hypothetical protein
MLRSHPAFTFFGRAAVPACAALVLALCAPVWAQKTATPVSFAPAPSAAVGEVTFAVGPAVRTSSDGMPEPVTRGTHVMSGDRIDTAEGGMVHIRFIDGALLSLRPGSRLKIEDYQYDPRHLAQSVVRFRLDQGVARAISGAAAQGAKERFRLNTPLVAIGVRGTDFVVRTTEQATSAAVNQGAIVMAPFDAGCLAQALGPCVSAGAKLLSADMGPLLVEFRPQLTQPEIRAVQGLMANNRLDHPDGAGGVGPSVAAATPGHTSQPGGDESLAVLVKDIVNTAGAPVSTPGPVPVVAAVPAQLMWGRWADGASSAGDMSIPLQQAAEGRSATVGNSQYVLYRAENAATLNAGLGAYDFTLQQSQAQFNTAAGQVQAASVQNGRLSIDFANHNFSTALSVTSAATGVVGVAGAGYVRDDGVFIDRTIAGQAIAGATALDGKTAGYFFEKAAAGGTLTGITLWNRP